jgi:abortive infection bacteriophage resistance protein
LWEAPLKSAGFFFCEMLASQKEPAATTHQEQLELLKSRGLIVNDEAKALHCLAHYNYYRILALRGPLIDPAKPSDFKNGTTFETLWELYCFDRNLRALLSEALKRVEISFRARWSYELAHEKGPYAISSLSVSGKKYRTPNAPRTFREDLIS